MKTLITMISHLIISILAGLGLYFMNTQILNPWPKIDPILSLALTGMVMALLTMYDNIMTYNSFRIEELENELARIKYPRIKARHIRNRRK